MEEWNVGIAWEQLQFICGQHTQLSLHISKIVVAQCMEVNILFIFFLITCTSLEHIKVIYTVQSVFVIDDTLLPLGSGHTISDGIRMLPLLAGLRNVFILQPTKQ